MVVVALASSRMDPVVKATWAALLIEATFEPMEAAFPTIMCWNTWPFIGTGKSYLRLATLCSITFFYSLFKEGFWLRGDFFFFSLRLMKWYIARYCEKERNEIRVEALSEWIHGLIWIQTLGDLIVWERNKINKIKLRRMIIMSGFC